jgi:NADH-quinone oxidoreductase subunit D
VTRITIPIGPQHPLLKEPLSFRLTAEGERVVDAAMRLGYVHRGIERLAEERTYVQNLHLLERVCGICSHVHTTTYCQGVEALLDLDVPPRGLMLRTLLCELERIHSHLLWLGVLAENIGYTTIFMYSWRDREIVLDIMEDLSGGRITHAVNVIGGVRIDLDSDHVAAIRRRLDELQGQVEDLRNVVEHERTLKARTQGVGGASLEQVRQHCIVGPVARAAGCDRDLRRDAPYAAYDRLSFEVVTESGGDVWSATRIRVREIVESLSLCHQILDNLPSGEVSTRASRRVPKGEVVARAEAPRGEVVYYIRSDGSDSPARIKIRTPTLPSLSLVQEQLRGINLADVPAVIAGIDLCIACADR